MSVILAGTLTWVTVTFLPGDAATRILGPHVTPERLHDLRIRLGLDRPILDQYLDWLTGLFTGNLGTSAISGESVTGLVLTRLGNSAALAGIVAVLALTVGITIGTLIGRQRRGRAFSNAGLLGASAVPDFVIGAIAVGLLAVSWRLVPSLSVIPPFGHVFSRPQILVIPVLAMGVPVTIWVARYTSAAVSRVAGAPHVRAARRMGIPEFRVITRHILPVALAPMIQLFGWMASILIGSTVIVEQLVQFPGIGSLLIEAVGDRDLPVATAVVTVLAAVVAVTIYFCDLLAARLDPRMVTR
ncbi:ABC transporter permease [Enemella sp. A6]|uniref:ABC transporter permease n=1 Tax=Enemella sp. A6 TaxID=3440152 RepID=UPI003EBAE9D4